jgi:hypothetical protein
VDLRFACRELLAQVSRAVVWLPARAGRGVRASRSSPPPPPPVAAPAPAPPAVRTCADEPLGHGRALPHEAVQATGDSLA